MATRIPISNKFEDRQKSVWEDMERDMERRRREWEDEIDKMRKEFFQLRPEHAGLASLSEGMAGSASRLPARTSGRILESDDGKPIIEQDDKGNPVFKVRFNMKDYSPEEVNVKMDTHKIMVSAKHEEKGGGSSVTREYSREVNIPGDVDPMALQCTFNPDGYLVVHAPLPVPHYHAVKDASSVSSQSPPGVMKSSSSSSYSTSSSNIQPSAYNNQPSAYNNQPSAYNNQQHQQQRSHVLNTQHAAPMPSSPVPNINIKPPPTFAPVPHFNKDDGMVHSEHIVPAFKPPPDLSQLDMLDNNVQRSGSSNFSTLSSQPQQSSMHSSSSSTLRSAPPPMQTPPFINPPPFGTLNTTFPAGPIFPDATKQAQLSTPVVTSSDGKFQLTMPIDDYKPEELTVKTQDGKVIICARRDVKTGNRSHTSEMSREHSLPDNVDPLTVKAFFTDTNNLIVEAPFVRS